MNTCKSLPLLQVTLLLESSTSHTTSSSLSFHAALYAWLGLYGTYGGGLGGVEPTKRVFNIFDVPEKKTF